jgi:tetratricopeptide (TPR) repeat protein
MRNLKKLFLAMVLFTCVKTQAQSIDDGFKAWNNENYNTARDIFKKVSDADPGNATALFYYGQSLFKTNDINGAKAAFYKGAAAKPEEYLCLVGQAKCMLEEANVADAEKKISAALKGSKNKDQDVLRYVGEAYAFNKNKDWTRAIDYATKATLTSKGKDDFNTFNTLGDIYFEKHYSGNGDDRDIGSAVTNYEKSYQLNPKSAYAMTKVGKIWSTTNNDLSYRNCIEALEKAKAAEPDFIPMHGVYAAIYSNTGLFEKAKAEQEIYMAGNEDKIKPNDRMINILYKLKDWNGTLTLAKKMNALFPDNCDYIRVLAHVNAELDSNVDAMNFFNQYQSKCDKSKMNIDDYSYLGKLYRVQGDDSVSEEYYKKVIALDPTREEAILKEISNDYFSARKYDLAIRAFINLNAKYPTPYSQFKLMDLYFLSKEWKETTIAADTFIVQNPGNPLGYLYKAKGLYFLDTMNERKASIDIYKVFLEKTKDTMFAKTFFVSDLIEANGRIFQYYINKNNYKEALIYCNEMVRLDPTNANFIKFKGIVEKRIKGGNAPAPTPQPGKKPTTPVKPKK